MSCSGECFFQCLLNYWLGFQIDCVVVLVYLDYSDLLHSSIV